MFKFRRSKNSRRRHQDQDDDDDEPMTGRGHSSSSNNNHRPKSFSSESTRTSTARPASTSSVPTANQRLLGKQQQSQQQRKGILGRRANSNSRVRTYSNEESQNDMDFNRRRSSDADDQSTEITEVRSSNSSLRGRRTRRVSRDSSNRVFPSQPQDSPLQADDYVENLTEDEQENDDDESYPSVGMNVVSSQKENSIPTIGRGMRSSSAMMTTNRRNEDVDRQSSANARGHRRTRSSSNTIATQQTLQTNKTTQSDKTHVVQSSNSPGMKSAEDAAMQQLAFLVVSLRAELGKVTKEKEGVEEKLKEMTKKSKKNQEGGNTSSPLFDELKRENLEMKKDIDAFIEENDALSKEIAELKEETEAANEIISRLKHENRKYSHSDVDLDYLPRGESRGSSSHAANSHNTAKTMGSSSSSIESKNQKLEGKIKELTEENHKLEGEIRLLVDEKQELMQENSEVVDESSSRLKDLEELRSSSREVKLQLEKREEEVSARDEELEQLRISLREMEERLEKQKEESKEEKGTADLILRLREEIADLTIVKEELKNELKYTSEYVSELEKEIAERDGEAKVDVEKYENKMLEYKSELKRAREELEKVKNDKGELQQRNVQLDVAKAELTKRVNDLVIKRSFMQKEMDKLKGENVKIMEELNKAIETNSSSAASARSSGDFSADIVLSLQKMISSPENSVDELEKELAEKKSEIKAEKEKVSRLEQKIKVQEGLSSAQDENDSELKIRITGLLTENEGMKPRIVRLEQEKKSIEEELEKIKSDLAEKEESMENMAASTRTLKSEHFHTVDKISCMEETISSLEQTKDQLESDLQEASEAIALLEDELDKKDAVVKGEMVKLTILRQRVSQFEKDKIASTKNIDELNEKISNLNNEVQAMTLEKKTSDEKIVSLQQANHEAEEKISKLNEELEESSDAIVVLKEELSLLERHINEMESTNRELEASLHEKEMGLQNLETAKSQLQSEHQVSIDTISTLQKMIHSYEKSKEELEIELNASSEKIETLREELKSSTTTSQLDKLERRLAESDKENNALVERVSELTAANEDMKFQIKDILLVSCTTRSNSAETPRKLISSDRVATCDNLVADLRQRIIKLLNERDSALQELEMFKRRGNHVTLQNSDHDLITEAPDDEDDMSHDTPVVETKPCDQDPSSPNTSDSIKTKPPISTSTSSSHGSSRGNSMLEQAKKLCHRLDEKRSKTPETRRCAETGDEVRRSSKQTSSEDLMKTTAHHNPNDKTTDNSDPSPDAVLHRETPPNNDSKHRPKSEKKFDIDQLTAIYFEKCGMSTSKLSDISSDASSSIRRRVRPENSNVVSKKVKICRNGVFMGTYEGDLNAEGQRHGFGVLICDNGNSYEGEWKKDKRDGLGIARYSSGDVYDGEWHRGKRQGHGVMYIEAGDTYIGSWNNGLKHGAGTYHWADGEVDVSWYQEDRRVGEGVRWNSTRTKAYRLVRGTRQEEISLDEAYKTAEKLGLNLTKVDSVSSQ